MTNFNWRTKLKLQTKKIKGTKNKPKIKRIRNEMKTTIYNQFPAKEIRNINEIKRTRIEIKQLKT